MGGVTEIPQWALDRAQQIVGDAPSAIIEKVAAYIMAHEDPPASPEVIFTRKVLSAFLRNDNRIAYADQIESGALDQQPAFVAALKLIEGAKSE